MFGTLIDLACDAIEVAIDEVKDLPENVIHGVDRIVTKILD